MAKGYSFSCLLNKHVGQEEDTYIFFSDSSKGDVATVEKLGNPEVERFRERMVPTDEVCAPCPRRPGNEGSRSKPRPGSEKLCFEPHGPGHHVRLGPLTLPASVSPAVKGGQWQAAGGLGRRKGVCGAVRRRQA